MAGDLYKDCHAVGGMSKYAWEDDPKRLTFTLARYKHVAKMLEGYPRVLEVGCADGFGSRIVRQHVNELIALDLDIESIMEAKQNSSKRWPIQFLCGTLPLPDLGRFDAVYSLDVLEHIEPGPTEDDFLVEMCKVAPVAIIGSPSLESQKWASRLSKEGHVNCKTGPEFVSTLNCHWQHVFLFSMHDEALGTGFSPMAQYRLALCVR